MNDAANRLREFREGARLTQRELGLKLNVTGPYVSMLEAGKRVPSLIVALKISKLTKKSAVGNILIKDWGHEI